MHGRNIPLGQLQPHQQEQHRSQQFHNEVARADLRAAVAALATQREVTDKWDVVGPPDALVALRAMRWWSHDGLIERHPVDADIKKAADDRAKREDDEINIELQSGHAFSP